MSSFVNQCESYLISGICVLFFCFIWTDGHKYFLDCPIYLLYTFLKFYIVLMEKKLAVKDIYSYRNRTSLNLPFIESRVHAGFPSPAYDYLENKLDLNEHLI